MNVLFLDIFTKSVSDFLDCILKTICQGAFALNGLLQLCDTKTAPAQAYVLMHHALVKVNGEKGVWGPPLACMGAITSSNAIISTGKGVEISDRIAAVKKYWFRDGKALRVCARKWENPEGQRNHRVKSQSKSVV